LLSLKRAKDGVVRFWRCSTFARVIRGAPKLVVVAEPDGGQVAATDGVNALCQPPGPDHPRKKAAAAPEGF